MFKVAVIGAGVIGLSTAYELQKTLSQHLTVTLFSEKFSPETTGDISAGLWQPYLLQDTPVELVIKWSVDTQSFAHDLWKNGMASEAGISLQPITALFVEKNVAMPSWAPYTYGAHAIDRQLLDKYGREHKVYYDFGYSFVSFTLEPRRLLPYLMKRFIEFGGSVIEKRINHFNELIDFDVIINCTGLNAKNLVNDEFVQPIRGQVIRVSAPLQFHVLFDDENYIIPNMDCVVLGGTHQVNDYNLSPTEQDSRFIFDGCGRLNPLLKSAKIQQHMVGLRPGRNQVRLEDEIKFFDNGKKINIVHNYGHGGSGVTLCTGCAKDVLHRVEKILNLNKPISKL